ncbi:MAG: hypothetical protein AAB436_04765 [Patescibacteria group bacterium]
MPQTGMPVRWMCIDKNAPHPACEVLEDTQLYRQVAAGASGVSTIYATVLEARKSGSFIKQNQTLPKFTGSIATICERYGVELLNHHVCTAQNNEEPITHTITVEPDDVFESAKEFKPDLTFSSFELIHKASKSLLLNKLIPKIPKRALEEMKQGDHQRKPIQTATLEEGSPPVGFFVDYREGRAFDVRDANASGTPAYASTMGDIGEITDAVRDVIDISNEEFWDAMAVRLGAIRLAHILDHDDEPLPVQIAA